MSIPRIYISGGFYRWQKDKERIRTKFFEGGISPFDPELAATYLPAEYVQADFKRIKECKIMLALQDEYPYVYGMAAEIGYAVASGVDVIYVCTAKRVDSFLAACSRAVFTDLDAAVDFIIRRYGKDAKPGG